MAKKKCTGYNLTKKEQEDLISRICFFDKERKCLLEGKLTTAHHFEDVLNSSSFENKKIQETILGLVIDEERNWRIWDVRFSIYCFGADTANFYLNWPKDGFRYQIIDLKKFSEEEVMGNIEALQTLSYSSFVYGSFEAAYKTKTDLIILKFYYRE